MYCWKSTRSTCLDWRESKNHKNGMSKSLSFLSADSVKASETHSGQSGVVFDRKAKGSANNIHGLTGTSGGFGTLLNASLLDSDPE